MGMKQLFLSYSRKDSEAVRLLKRLLEDRGYTVWMDIDEIHAGRFRDKIAEGIQACSVVIWVASTHSIASEYVAKEVTVAFHLRKPVEPVYLTPRRELPLSGVFLMELAGVQGHDFAPATQTLPSGVEAALKAHGVRSAGSSFHPLVPTEAFSHDCESLVWLVDRLDQANHFRRAFGMQMANNRGATWSLVVHGPEDERVSRFGECLDRYHLRKCAGEHPVTCLGSRILVSDADVRAADTSGLLFDLSSVIPDCRGFSVEDIAGAIARNNGVCVATFFICTGKLHWRTLQRFVSAFVELFDGFPSVGSSVLVIKLEIEYTATNAGNNRRLREWLDQQESAPAPPSWSDGLWRWLPLKSGSNVVPLHSRQRVCVLPALRKIFDYEAAVWCELSEVQQLLSGMRINPERARQILSELFRQITSPASIKDIAHPLSQALLAFVRA